MREKERLFPKGRIFPQRRRQIKAVRGGPTRKGGFLPFQECLPGRRNGMAGGTARPTPPFERIERKGRLATPSPRQPLGKGAPFGRERPSSVPCFAPPPQGKVRPPRPAPRDGRTRDAGKGASRREKSRARAWPISKRPPRSRLFPMPGPAREKGRLDGVPHVLAILFPCSPVKIGFRGRRLERGRPLAR